MLTQLLVLLCEAFTSIATSTFLRGCLAGLSLWGQSPCPVPPQDPCKPKGSGGVLDTQQVRQDEEKVLTPVLGGHNLRRL